MLLKNHPHLYHNFTVNMMEFCDLIKLSEVKRETGVAVKATLQDASQSHCNCILDSSDPGEVPRVKVETDIAETDSCCDPREVPRVKVETDIAETDSCYDPREVPRVKVKTDIAAASTQSDSGCDTMDCYKPDPSHTSEVKIEIDVAEETPLSWTLEDPVMQSKLLFLFHTDLENSKSHFH